ncbi:MAG: replication-associated recombination protein A [Pseudomonadota bacterium]|nr:replication-associated recombination protein A [Pseudomonadota bacterium]
MDLFSYSGNLPVQNHKLIPLAERLRPTSLDDVLGQSEIVGEKSVLKKMLAQGVLPNTLFWGPPGTGKTTLARILASAIEAELFLESATDLGAKEIRELGASAQSRKQIHGRHTVIFVDEIHRLNKSQQDNFLPFIEKGDFTLIGATTENPSYELNSALLSRCQVFILKPLKIADLQKLLQRAFKYSSLDSIEVLTEEASSQICELAKGDGRALINMVEGVLNLYFTDSKPAVDNTEFVWPLAADALSQVLGSRLGYYDKKSDNHYDTISAFIKSVRGSDASAALYYLARMIKFGEDPKFIARRLIVLASEDVGNADPRALSIAIAGFQAVEIVGLPEAAINLAHVVTYLSTAPKSNRSYKALIAAQEEVERTGALPVPLSLRSGNSQFLKSQGYGEGYKYSHNSETGFIAQEFFPQEILNKNYYMPSSRGYEKQIAAFLDWLKSQDH